MTSRKPATEGEDFPLLDSEYADDTGVLFDTRETLVLETPKLIQHIECFGIEIHLGNTITKKASRSQIFLSPSLESCIQIRTRTMAVTLVISTSVTDFSFPSFQSLYTWEVL